jgi:hypothetical protein
MTITTMWRDPRCHRSWTGFAGEHEHTCMYVPTMPHVHTCRCGSVDWRA